MKKVGFIDYYLDEWHANHYPEFIKEHSNGEFEVCCAYGKIDSPIGGMTNKEWSEKYQIPLCATPEEVVANSDVLIVLSPDNPEMHEELCDVPLKSGKYVYIDKTFAPTRDAALRIFEKADAHGTKCYSSSALGFASELDDVDTAAIDAIYCEGPGNFEVYIIHLIEPLVRLMNAPAKRVMYTGTGKHSAATIEFADGRICHLLQRNDPDNSYHYTLMDKENNSTSFSLNSDYFGLFIDGLVHFFRTGELGASHERTVTAISVREALMNARKTPFTWVEIR